MRVEGSDRGGISETVKAGGIISALMQERDLTHSLCIGQQVVVFGL